MEKFFQKLVFVIACAIFSASVMGAIFHAKSDLFLLAIEGGICTCLYKICKVLYFEAFDN